MSFDHYLITRFNLKVPEWGDRDKHGVLTRTDAWMKHRFGLFEKYTVPAIANQTTDNFDWFVLFDKDTENHWIERLSDLFPLAYPLFLSSDWLNELQIILKAMTTQKWLVTTRLDNDDRVHPTFMSTIQNNIHQKKQWLNIPNGWCGSKPVQHRANHFITYVEPSAESRSVYFTAHGLAMAKYAPIKQITKHRLWVQIIHKRNYRND